MRPPYRAAPLAAALLLLIPCTATAEQPLDGYRGAEFGMSVEELRASLDTDDIVTTNYEETPAGDVIIDGHLKEDENTGVRYVFPGGRDELALVVEFRPDTTEADALKADLSERYGEPWAEDMSEAWYEQLKHDMPNGVESLMVWGGDAPHRSRFVRLWAFDDYLSVEYLDTELLQGAP